MPIVQETGLAPGPVWMSVENLAVNGAQFSDCPASSEGVFQLWYPGPQCPVVYNPEDHSVNLQ